MNCLTDYHARLLPMMGEHIASPADSLLAMDLLHEKYGIKRFCLIAEYDYREESVAMLRLRMERSLESMASLLQKREFRVETAGCALVLPEVSRMEGLHRLRLPKTDYLPIRFSLARDADARLLELNRLLYHFPLKLLFLSFDQLAATLDQDALDRLLSLPSVAYQFSYRSLTDPRIRDILRLLLRKRAPILFGSEITSPGEAAYYELDSYLECARREFSCFEYETLLFQKKIFQS